MSPKGQPSKIDVIIEKLGSGNAETRLDALDALREFAGNRQAYQAIRGLLRDPDRDVRVYAQQVLAEYDRAWESSLALVPGSEQEKAAAGDPIPDLLKKLKLPEEDERLAALQKLLQYSDPRVEQALRDVHLKDPSRTMRQFAEAQINKRKEERRTGERTTRFEGHVMVVEDGGGRVQREGKVVSGVVDSLGPGFVTTLGIVLLIPGLITLAMFGAAFALGLEKVGEIYAAAVEGLDLTMLPAAGAFYQWLAHDLTELHRALGLVHGAWLTIGSAAFLFRLNWGRWMVMVYLVLAVVLGFLIGQIWGGIGALVVCVPLAVFLSRRGIVAQFRGHKDLAPDFSPAPIQDEDRQVW